MWGGEAGCIVGRDPSFKTEHMVRAAPAKLKGARLDGIERFMVCCITWTFTFDCKHQTSAPWCVPFSKYVGTTNTCIQTVQLMSSN